MRTEGHDPNIPSGAVMVPAERSASTSPRASRPERLSRPQLFREVARLYGLRSSCPRADVGVVAIRDGRIVATGYCGAPRGQAHCLEVGCLIVEGHCVRSVHAEANMVAWAARVGISIDNTEIYSTHEPCHNCAKLLANAGVFIVYYEHDYQNHLGSDLLRSLGVTVRKWR